MLKLCNMFSHSPSAQPNRQQPSTFDNMEAKLIDTNAVELQDVDQLPPAASSTLRGTLSRSMNSSSSASLRKNSSKNISIFSNIDCQLFTSTSSQALVEKLVSIVDIMEDDLEKYRLKLANLKTNSTVDKGQIDYLDSHGKLMGEQLKALKEVCSKINRGFPQSCSTPYRSTNNESMKHVSLTMTSALNKSIHGAELNKSYVHDQLQPELSVRDISSWFHLNKPSETILEQMEADVVVASRVNDSNAERAATVDELTRCIDNLKIDTQMANFKDLLLKVREIVDDSYSDNTELARTTQQLEKALDKIIAEEERKRLQGV